MTDHVDYLIIGSGPAGVTAAETLRAEEATGSILILGKETDLPYARPPLSKQLLLGLLKPDQLCIFPPSDYLKKKIDIRLNTRVVSVNPKAHVVETDIGQISYGKLLIATGMRPVHLDVPGSGLPGVLYLRTLSDALAIQREMTGAKQAVIVGGNFIGLELASSFTQQGIQVTMIVEAGELLAPLQTPEISAYLRQYFEERGVEILFHETISSFLGQNHVESILTGSGGTIPCDFVALGVGVTPETEFLEGSGIGIDKGVHVDEYLQTNKDDIYAAGDVAYFYDPVFALHRRLEHWDNAVKQGRLAARNMIGQHLAYGECAYFFSNVFDLTFEFFGNLEGVDERIFRSSPDGKSLAVFYLKENVLSAFFTMHRPPEETKAAESLILNKVNVGKVKDALSDPLYSLGKIARRTVFILQGGGAMGAFECGVVKATAELGIPIDIVAGVSIGAFNAAIIAGNPDNPAQALEAFWKDIALDQPGGVDLISDSDWRRALANMQGLLFGVPNFFRPRWLTPRLSPDELFSTQTSFYDTAPIRKLLSTYVDFSRLKKSPVRLLINAVNVETSELVTFDSRYDDITVDHVLASGSLPPGFPWTTIDGKSYWDGGIVSNSPLEQVIEHCDYTAKRVIVVDLFPNRRRLPSTIMGVVIRRNEIAYAERIRKDTRIKELIYNFRLLIDDLLNAVDELKAGEFKQQPHYIAVMGNTSPMEITRIIYETNDDGQQPRDYDFSRESINKHISEGHRMALKALQAD